MSSINNVKLDRPIEIIGFIITDCYSEYVPDCHYLMSVKDGKQFIDSLKTNNLLNIITDTLQSLSMRKDGTNLETAMPSIQEFKNAVITLDGFPQELIDLLPDWEKNGVNEINIQFES